MFRNAVLPFLVFSLVAIGAGCTQSQSGAQETVTVSGITFDVPANWSVMSNNGTTAEFSVPDAEYNVSIPMEVEENSISSAKLESDFQELGSTAAGFTVYEEFCAPSLGCFYLRTETKTYQITFLVPNSDEPVPANLDGVWFPGTDVTEEELLEIVLSAR